MCKSSLSLYCISVYTYIRQAIQMHLNACSPCNPKGVHAKATSDACQKYVVCMICDYIQHYVCTSAQQSGKVRKAERVSSALLARKIITKYVFSSDMVYSEPHPFLPDTQIRSKSHIRLSRLHICARNHIYGSPGYTYSLGITYPALPVRLAFF